jgi:hypothetical protein
MTAVVEKTEYPLIADDWSTGADPLEGIPQEVVAKLGAMDYDTAGGCG